MTHSATWREPDEETEDYPGLVVHDGRVSGSITTGQSRLPLWCFTYTALVEGWDDVERGWGPSKYGWTAERFAEFLYNLLEARGEFGRLLCVLADVERDEQSRDETTFNQHYAEVSHEDGICTCGIDEPLPWWAHGPSVERMRDALRRCLATLEDENIARWAEEIARAGVGITRIRLGAEA